MAIIAPMVDADYGVTLREGETRKSWPTCVVMSAAFSWIATAIAVLLGALLLPTVPAAAQDCNLTIYGADVSVQGSARLQAGTNQQNCQGVEVQVRARVANAVSPTCSKTWYGSLCGDNNSGGHAVVTTTSQGCPIIIAPRRGARYELTSAADGVSFDIDGDGAVEQVAWTARGSEVAFLALDRDGNGLITSGKELFGNNTIPGVTNGFEALLRMNLETNGGIMRGSVSNDDPLFARLLLWTDTNHNGFSESWELTPASELLSDIGLGYNISQRKDRHGNLFRFLGWAHVRTEPGRNRARTKEQEDARRIPIWDAYLRVAPR